MTALTLMLLSAAASSGLWLWSLPEIADPEPLGNPGTWAMPNDYPDTALREGAKGTVVFNLNIDEQGKVTDCKVLKSSGHASLDDRTCDLMRVRAKFKPARDEDGNAIAGIYSTKVFWDLP